MRKNSNKFPILEQQSREVPLLLSGFTFHVHTLHMLFQIIIISQPLTTYVANVFSALLVFDEENGSHPSTIKRYAFAPQRHLVSHCTLRR